MKVIRQPMVSAAIAALGSLFYAGVFWLISGHAEFARLIHGHTLSSPFWNGWNAFLAAGDLRYVGLGYLALAAAIVVLSAVKGRAFDEYQCRMLEKGLIVSGAALIVLFPLLFVMVMSDANYVVEYVTLLAAVYWTVVLATDLICLIVWTRD